MKTKIIEAVKPYATKPNIAIGLFLLLFLFQVGKLFYGKTPDNSQARHEQLEKSLKELERNDKDRASELKTLRAKRTSDSLQLAGVKFLVENVPHILNHISLKYEKDRRNLASMPFDARFLFFANYVAKGDSIANR